MIFQQPSVLIMSSR